ncbi:MAG: leucyl aminopeptidase family protein [Hyphomicrobiaceae bacterium]
MLSVFATAGEVGSEKPVLLHAVQPKELERFLAALPAVETRWLNAIGFAAKDGELQFIPSESGRLHAVVLGLGAGRDPLALAALSERLPAGLYALGDVPAAFAGARAAYAWAIGTYKFERYRKHKKPAGKEMPRLVLPDGVDTALISRLADGVFLARDLINTPANDMGPAELEQAARDVAGAYDADMRVLTGEELISANYPLIHAVGRASAREPRLIDFSWGRDRDPKVTLIGKGVCFDTGGLDIKTSAGMLTMKKDMGGAACVLGLARAIMDAKLPVKLRVMIPAIENSISGTSYRPGDVLVSRKGLSIEIGNTDAEGRVILADALAEADSESPDLLFCLATLTGAARAATGMELPPFFTDDEHLASDLMRHGTEQHDPLWRLPLWRSYETTVDSPIADVNNSPDYSLAGAITAALFLNRFITKTERWAHFDIPAWTDRPKPGRRKGGEANGIRAMYAVIAERFGK